jgi:hypothetical protein
MKPKLSFFIIVLALLFIYNNAIAQNDITSPYSFLGLGDKYQRGNIRSLSMGGTDIALRSNNYINMMNPAGLSGVDTMSFLGSVGLSMNNTNYRTSELNSSFTSTNINHLALALPLTRWWKTSIKLLPYSTVGYQVFDYDEVENGGRVQYEYKGSGGMDMVSWTNAFSITPNLAFGFNASYYFGKVEHDRSLFFLDSVFVFSSLVRETVAIDGFFFEAGLQYFVPLNESNTLGFGLTYGNKSKLNAEIDYFAVTFLGDDTYNNPTLDTIRTWSLASDEVRLPYRFGAGVSWTRNNNLTVAADFRFENWKDFKYLDRQLEKSNKIFISTGAEFIPESNTLSAYWKMIHYRAGFRYEQIGIKIADNNINEYAISLGFGLPLRKSATFINLGFELGQSGTIENNLIQERFLRVLLGISIKENWFRKSKYY